jgi:Uncharacterised nucleotidyltransferase
VYTGKNSLEPALSDLTPFGAATIEKEWEFLRAAASPARDPQILSARLSSGFDWDVALTLAEEHGVLGLLAQRLHENNYRGVPSPGREQLQSRMRGQLLFTLSMTAELFRILEDFSKAGIETLLVKGPLISFLAYGDPAVRSYVDLDLLVRHSEILHATQRMISLGFLADVPESVIEAGKVPGEYLFKPPGTQRLVELHTERTFRYYPRPMRIEDLFQRQRRVLLDGREVPALSLEDELLLNCIHGAKHFWERLIWVSDVAALVTRHPEIDWQRACQSARDVGAERMLRVGLQLGATLLGSTVPPEMAVEVAQDAPTRHLVQQVSRWLPSAGYAPPSLAQRARFRMEMSGGGIAGAAYLLRLSFSPTEEDWAEGKEEQRSWLWDAIRRPFRLLRKYGQDG